MTIENLYYLYEKGGLYLDMEKTKEYGHIWLREEEK